MRIVYIFLLCFGNLLGGDFIEQIIQIKNASKKDATINVGNLQIGQSGIIINTENKNNSVILCYATVVSSDLNSSKIEFQYKNILMQDALPKTNLKPKDGDQFIINHLYKNALLIAPNFEASSNVKKLNANIHFLESDFFAAYLKINENPTPKKEDLLDFAHQNDLGRIFIITDKTLNMIDAISFKIVDQQTITFEDNTTTSPFYANIEEIKTGTFNFFGEENIGDYNKYYKKLLGIKDGK